MIITIVFTINNHPLISGDMVMSGRGLSTIPKIFPGEADKGAAGCDGPPAASPGALHPTPSFTSKAFVGLLHTTVKFLINFHIWLILLVSLCVEIVGSPHLPIMPKENKSERIMKRLLKGCHLQCHRLFLKIY